MHLMFFMSHVSCVTAKTELVVALIQKRAVVLVCVSSVADGEEAPSVYI